MKNIFLLMFVVGICGTICAQVSGICGVSVSDQLEMKKKRYPIRASRTAPIYIPVSFHLVADGDGKNRARVSSVFDALTKINADYKDTEFQFYLKDPVNWSTLNHSGVNSNAFNNHSSMVLNKIANSMNLFMVQKITDENSVGNTLGYYLGSGDYIVLAQSVLNGTSIALAHEIGHFLSLPHTFLGWEGSPYNEADHGNPLTITKAPGTSINIELADGSNCADAADGICDTPPDYNFGISANDCSFNKIILDSNSDTVKPLIRNYMSYFLGCDDNAFTPNQISRMSADFADGSRNYLRHDYVPNTLAVVEDVVLKSPSTNKKIDTYNYVELDWEDQPSADQYLVEIYNNNEYYFYFTTNSFFAAMDLQPNLTYFWRVRGFNDGNTSKQGASKPLRTGDVFTSNEDVLSLENKYSIYPNPVAANFRINLEIESKTSETCQISLFSIDGKLINSFSIYLNEGLNTTSMDLGSPASGLYLVEFQSKTSRSVKKLLVK